MPDLSALLRAPTPPPSPTALPPSPAAPPPSDYEAKGIEIRYRADPHLNLYGDQSHTLALVVYQLSSPNMYTQLLRDEEGVRKLLQAKPFDPGVLYVNRYMIQPGEENSFFMDRAENARWIGLVAGYFELAVPRTTRLIKIPLLPQPGESSQISRPGALVLNLILGPQGIHRFGEKP